MSTPPPMPPVPHLPTCSRHGNGPQVPRVAFAWRDGVPLPPLRICPLCDMGNPSAGPPVMLDYLKRGHQ